MYALDIEDVANKGSAAGARRNTIADSHYSLEEQPLGIVELLDQFIPLDRVSHAEVASYTVEIPMRYARCFAILADGEKVGLQRSQQFAGWSGWVGRRSFIFVSGEILFEIKTDADHSSSNRVPGNIQSVIVETAAMSIRNRKESITSINDRNGIRAVGNSQAQRKFIATDGSQIVLPPPT